MKARCIVGVLILSALSVTANKSYARVNNRPVAVLNIHPNPVIRGNPATLDASGSWDPGGHITQYCWDWTNNDSYDHCESGSDDKKGPHTYSTCGNYQAKLRVKDNSNTYSYRTISFSVIPPAPNLVSPDDGLQCHSLDSVTLVWNSVPGVDYYKVYFSDTNSLPSDCNTDSNSLEISPLQGGTIYYWKVETYENGKTNSSNLWSFTTRAGKATNPDPNGTTGEPIDTVLRWTTGEGATSHNIYFGTDFNDVNNAYTLSDEFKANTANDVNYYDTRRICAFLFDDNKVTNIGSLGRAYEEGLNTTTWAEAFAINESGKIVGVSYDPNGNPHAFINIPGEGNEPSWTSSLTDLHTFSGIDQSAAYGISNTNRIVGSAGGKAFYLKYPGDMNELPSLYSETDHNSVARAVTDGADGNSPSAAGWSGGHAVLWDNLDSNNPNIYDLGTVEKYCRSKAYNINKYRQVVGCYWFMSGDDSKDRAFVGNIESGLTDIGTLEPGNVSRSFGINNAGQVVGEATIDPNDNELRAFIYDNCQMLNLNELIETGPNDPCYVVISAQSVNDDGYIVGYGKILDSNDPDSNFHRAILLVPIRPIAHWKLDETYGGTAPDSSVIGNHGQVYGAVWTTGKIHGALRFDGQDDYVTAESMVLDPGTCDFTVAVWVSLDVNDVNQALVSQSDGTQWLQISDDGKLSTELGGTTDSNGTTLATETWYHVALTKSANKVNFFLNGNLDGNSDQIIGEVDSATGNIVFGSNKECNDNFFDGIMDDLRIYPWALSQTEISELFEGRL